MRERVFLVGGAVRDRLMGLPTKDFDFAVEAESFDAMREMVESRGGEIFVEDPEFFTIRARDLRGELTGQDKLTADFVLCRKDIGASDGRHPDAVEVGDIFDDLARRDFTANAIAIEVGTDELIDPFDGEVDIANKTLRCVGDTAERMNEDALRAIRAVRFDIIKGLKMDRDLKVFLWEDEGLPVLLDAVSTERKRDELLKCFKHDTRVTLAMLASLPERLVEAMLPDEIWLKPTMENR